MADAYIHQTTVDVARAGGTVDIDEQNLHVPIWFGAAVGPVASATKTIHVPAKAGAPVASAPKTLRVPANAGASKKAGVLNVYAYIGLDPTGVLIAQLASHYPRPMRSM